jgi:predicted alpha/beta hydrolase family esterase
MTTIVYYLTGMNGHLTKGLGEALLSRHVDVTGRELVDDFRGLDFQQQIDTVCDDLANHFWSKESHVIANSFGAYLLLHALAKLNKTYVAKVLLLSPIIGEFSNEETLIHFIPPRSTHLFEVAQRGAFPKLTNSAIHVGSEDWQSNPSSVKRFGDLVGIDVHVVQDGGHMLPKDYVGNLLDVWLHTKEN